MGKSRGFYQNPMGEQNTLYFQPAFNIRKSSRVNVQNKKATIINMLINIWQKIKKNLREFHNFAHSIRTQCFISETPETMKMDGLKFI